MNVVVPDHTHLLFDVTTPVFVLRGYRKSFTFNVVIISIVGIIYCINFPIGVIYIPYLRSSVGRRSYPVDN